MFLTLCLFLMAWRMLWSGLDWSMTSSTKSSVRLARSILPMLLANSTWKRVIEFQSEMYRVVQLDFNLEIEVAVREMLY